MPGADLVFIPKGSIEQSLKAGVSRGTRGYAPARNC